MLPLRFLLEWEPFRLDALGLVTLLGADQVSHSVGRLVRSRWLEYMPLLGAYVIASDGFREKVSGPTFFNVPQGFTTNDLAPWHSRWLVSQEFHPTRSIIRWSVLPPQSHWFDFVCGLSLSIVSCGMLVILTVFMADWWGLANAIAIIAAILVRAGATAACTYSIDRRINEMFPYDGHDIDDIDNNFTMLYPQDSGDWNHRADRCLLVTEDTKCVTVIMPYRLLASPSVFIAKLEPASKPLYNFIKAAGWIGFAVHVIAIGMADLVTQIYTVVLLVLPTVLLSWKFGCEDANWRVREKFKSLIDKSYRTRRNNGTLGDPNDDKFPTYQYGCFIGSRLRADIFEWPLAFELEPEYGRMPDGSVRRSEKRIDLYSWLQLTEDEEKSMEKWEFFPHNRGANNTMVYGVKRAGDVRWWKSYLDKKAHIATLIAKLQAESGLDSRDRFLSPGLNRTDSVAIELGKYSMHGGNKGTGNGSVMPRASAAVSPHRGPIPEEDV